MPALKTNHDNSLKSSIKTLNEASELSNNNTNASNNNGSFVLVVNITPSEFRLRQNEIIKEFEKKLGILMLIKKEPQSNGIMNDMIYPFYSNNTKQSSSSSTPWTKVYFIIIFACVYDDTFYRNTNNSICLQNSLNNVNDPTEIVSELKKASNSLMPPYVSNITYEAYSADLNAKRKKPANPDNDNKDSGPRLNNDTWSTSLVIFLAVGLLTGISLALTVLIRQNAVAKRMMIKAPIWYPPPIDGQTDGLKKCPKIGEYSSKDGKWFKILA